MSNTIGPVRPCGHFDAVPDCEYIRVQLGRSRRHKPLSCSWMTENGFTRSSCSLNGHVRTARSDGLCAWCEAKE